MHPGTVFFPLLRIFCAKCTCVWRIYPFIRWSFFFFTKKGIILLEIIPKSSMYKEKEDEIFGGAGQVGLPLPQCTEVDCCSCLCGKLLWSFLVFYLGTNWEQVAWFDGNDWNCTLLLESTVWVSCRANPELCRSQEFQSPNQTLNFCMKPHVELHVFSKLRSSLFPHLAHKNYFK